MSVVSPPPVVCPPPIVRPPPRVQPPPLIGVPIPGSECTVCGQFTIAAVPNESLVWVNREVTLGTCERCSAAKLLQQLKQRPVFNVVVVHHNPVDVMKACLKALEHKPLRPVDLSGLEMHTFLAAENESLNAAIERHFNLKPGYALATEKLKDRIDVYESTGSGLPSLRYWQIEAYRLIAH